MGFEAFHVGRPTRLLQKSELIIHQTQPRRGKAVEVIYEYVFCSFPVRFVCFSFQQLANMTTPVEITDPQSSGPQFDTYAQYLEWIKDKWTEYEELRDYLSDINNRSNPKGFVHVNDILPDGSIHRPLGSHWYRTSDSNSTLSTDESLRTALSTCLIGTRTRMIFVQQAGNVDGNGLHPSIIDAIGLTFDVEPLFFLLAMKADQEAVPRHPKFLRIGSIWVKVLEDVTIGLAKPLISLWTTFHG